MAAIFTQDLVKVFGSVRAVDGLDLTVAEGKIFGFLGPNGAGKTTTIRLLTGLAVPTSGKAQVAGVNLGSDGSVRGKVGYLPEEPAFYSWMSPVEFLRHVGRMFSLDSTTLKKRTNQLLEQVGLSEVSKRRIGGFSRGMRQRLGLAQALINHPEVLFLDEPVSALDPAGHKEVLDLIDSLRGQCTVFISTHILADVERVCDTVGIIDRGKLLEVANQEELLKRYTVPAFEVACESGSEGQFDAWLQQLKQMNWVVSIQTDGNSARVLVNDMNLARTSLLSQAAASHLPLHRIEVVTPSLEDVFLKLVDESHGKSK
jgi:ABC-2 type transport system ATP-binding protein